MNVSLHFAVDRCTVSFFPDWMISSKDALLRKFVRNKSDPLCEYVELIEVNPKYALVKRRYGRESTVPVKDLAP